MAPEPGPKMEPGYADQGLTLLGLFAHGTIMQLTRGLAKTL